jgi:iron complex transport system substrate-binding protein
MRVVSLLPYATESLCFIGAEHLLVGRSHECDFPSSIAHVPILTSQRTHGGTSAEIDAQVREALNSDAGGASLYKLDEVLFRELKPDVILTQDLCDVCSIDLRTVERLASEMSPRPQVVSLNPKSLEDVFDDLLRVGDAVNLREHAIQSVVGLRDRFWSVRDFVNPYIDGPEVAFLEWMDPLFAGGHWTPQLISNAGARHSLNAPRTKSRQITPEELVESMPQRLIICPCGFDVRAIRRDLHVLTSQRWWKTLPAVLDERVVLVDGNQMFNRPGPRLVDAYCWLVGWINDRPELIPADFPVANLQELSPAPAKPPTNSIAQR